MSAVSGARGGSAGRRLATIASVVLLGGVGGCASQQSGVGTAGGGGAAGAAKVVHHRRATRRHRRHRARTGGSGLAFSRASNQTVQAQLAPGSCHALGHGVYSRPDPHCTPGALNPSVQQANIQQTICVTGWTATVRPPESITEPEKQASLAAYGDSGPLSDYEYDHLVPLELGGATNDRRNLWPQPGGSPNPKDSVEFDLRTRVCSGQMTLASAQREIARNWVKASGGGAGESAGSGGGGSGSTAGARCSVHAVFNSSYHDYDVYVRSNQPGQTVTVTSHGHSRNWHTDAGGAADVFFPGGAAAAGQPIGVRVGHAHCGGRL